MSIKVWQCCLRWPACVVAALCHLFAIPAAAQVSPGWTPFDDWTRVVLARTHALGATALDPTPSQHTLGTIRSIADSSLRAHPILRRLHMERASSGDARLHFDI